MTDQRGATMDPTPPREETGPSGGAQGRAFWRSAGGVATAVVAAAVVAGTTYLHGRMTDRWAEQTVSEDLQRAARLLETRFPRRFGEWQAEEDIGFDPRELERAGAVGHISRVYINKRNGAKVTAFVVCATPRDASGHTPDRCYPGAGFEIAETEHREKMVLADGRAAEAFTGTFRKEGQTLRVYWTYGVDGRWVAPQIARIELADARAVYKLYAIIEETSLPAGLGTQLCGDFLKKLLPEFDTAVSADGEPQGSET